MLHIGHLSFWRIRKPVQTEAGTVLRENVLASVEDARNLRLQPHPSEARVNEKQEMDKIKRIWRTRKSNLQRGMLPTEK